MGQFDVNSLDEYERQERDARHSRGRSAAIFFVICISFSVGLLFYLIFNFAVNGGFNNENYTSLDLSDPDVRTLYSYVSYGTRGIRNDKFIANSTVTMNSFSDSEKFYYALQFAKASDFVYTGENNSSGQKIFNISDNTIRTYMVMFFGPNITYSNNVQINYVFPFNVGKMNVAKMTYNTKRKGFDVVFNKYLGYEGANPINDQYYTRLAEAFRLDDGKIILREKVVYVEVNEVDGLYNLYIYKDPSHQQMIDQRINLTSSQLENSIDWYNLKTAYIEYTFALNGTVYYFSSSQIFYE